MSIKPLALVAFRRLCACLALSTACAYAGSETSSIDGVQTPTFEAGVPSRDIFPLVDSPIPGDNPIGALLLNKQHPLSMRADFRRIGEFVIQSYRNSHFQPLWLTAHRSEKNLQDLLAILSDAPSNALNPSRYNIDNIRTWIGEQALEADAATNYDVGITVSLVSYLYDLRHGQIDLRDVGYPVHIAPKPPLDIAGLLQQHLTSETLPELVKLFEPKAKQYQQLKQVLLGLQQFDKQKELAEFAPRNVLRPGDKHNQIPALRLRLRAMGALTDDSENDDKIYDDTLVTAVKSLQGRQGLKADGVIGPATLALFNQPPAQKIGQLELAMERARWLPDIADGPMIVVNIPAFELWAFTSTNDTAPLNMKVIVGKAPNNQTPILWEEMKYLEFMPYWNIPQTIFKKEIMPKVANNQGYLASQEIELIRHRNSEEKGGGSYIRARQRPGKKNPLGRVKFVFPNTADVYLHDTPSRAAFSRQRRDLSHGCVRVAEPERLAEFVLGDQQGWDKESIKQAMSAPKTRHVTLKHSVPVLFYYATTFVDHQNQLRFYPDVYGQDEQLKQALNKLNALVPAQSGLDSRLSDRPGAELAAFASP